MYVCEKHTNNSPVQAQALEQLVKSPYTLIFGHVTLYRGKLW